MHRFARIPCRPLGFAPWLAALAWISTAGVAFAAERTNLRWAIVSVDPRGSALADLLTPKLSQWTDVELVERDAIDKVLKELDLAAGGLGRGGAVDAVRQAGRG